MHIIISTVIIFTAIVMATISFVKNDISNGHKGEGFSQKQLLIFAGFLMIVCVLLALITSEFERLYVRNKIVETVNELQQSNYRSTSSSSSSSDTEEKTGRSKSGIEVISPNKIKTKFSDIAGMVESKDEVQDVIKFLNNPEKYSRLGAKSPKGVLLFGAPGTGKTLLARAIAGEAGVSFIAVSGSQFDEEYVGVGASRVRELFKIARLHSPCIIFIDEIDTVAFKRKARDPSWSAQTINQLLSELDGLNDKANHNVVLIGATNRKNILDPAILRPGRLDRHIKIDLPTVLEREQILKLYIKKIKTHKDISFKKLAKMTSNFSAAELSNLVNESAIIATKNDKDSVDMESFDIAKDRVILGSKRSALRMTDEDKKLTAYHEAGHTIVGHVLNKQGKGKNKLYKVTITARGPSLGHTSFERGGEEDNTSVSYEELNANIATSLGGRVAEEMIFGSNKITTGAESDLQHANHIAYNMVTKWGYSEKVGLINVDGIGDTQISNDTITSEVKLILNSNLKVAKAILENNKDKLDKLALALLKYETLDAKQIDEVLR